MAAPSSDRNLLIGVLALQMDFITRDQLVEALHDWVLDKRKSLDGVLLESKAIDAGTRDLILALVNKHLELHQGDPQRSLAALSSVGLSLREELRSLSDPQVEATLAVVGSQQASEQSCSDLTTAITLGRQSSEVRFRILRPHAKGGLGMVSVALDQELHREVALKEIQERHADEPESRARFLLEAEITGRLEHPGIVPVYGLGTYGNGRPFYAMRFIKGDSLKEAADRFHSSDLGKSPLSWRSLKFRQLLGRFIDVCQAVEYAHSRGVLHRDLKPGNIMLGKYGETLIVDWGLSKVVGREDVQNYGDEASLKPMSGSGTAPTLMGAAIGTPQYMSPEQAAGRLDQLGPESDVYSLGATLYFLLTGKTPFEGDEAAVVLQQVRTGQFRQPRQVNPAIPRAVEAICLKAMSLRPSDRYPTALALAGDVERWLADEPVTAYREPWRTRVVRWMRRRKTVVLATAASAALLLMLLLWKAEQRRADEMDSLRAIALVQRDAAREQRLLAEESQADAAAQRKRAEILQYASDMNMAFQSWLVDDVGRAVELLNLHGAERQYPYDFRGLEWNYLWRITHPDVVSLQGHTEPVWHAAFSPDGSQLVSGGSDGMLRVWNTSTGQGLAELGPAGKVACLDFSPDGKWIASGSPENSLTIWEAATGKKSRTLPLEGSACCVAFSPTRNLVAAGERSAASKVRIWDLATGEEVYSHASRGLNAVAFSPDGNWIATGALSARGAPGGIGEARVRDWAKNEDVFSSENLAGGVKDLRFSPDGERLFAALASPGVKAWRLPEGREVVSTELNDLRVVFNTPMAISPDCTLVATDGGGDRKVRVWEIASGNEKRRLKGHTNVILGVKFGPDGRLLASCGADKAVNLWNLGADPEGFLLQSRQPASALAVASRSDRLVLGSKTGDVLVWDVEGRSELCELSMGDRFLIPSVALHPSGELVAAANGRKARVWNVASREPAFGLEGVARGAVAFSPDGQHLACFGADNDVRVVDLQGREICVLKGHAPNASPGGLVFSPDSARLASGTLREIKVWEIASQREIISLSCRSQSSTPLAFGRDGELLACPGAEQGWIVVRDLNLNREVATLKGHLGDVRDLVFSPDGSRLVSVGLDQTIRFWLLSTARESLIMNYPVEPKIDISQDGRRLFMAFENGTVQALDIGPPTSKSK